MSLSAATRRPLASNRWRIWPTSLRWTQSGLKMISVRCMRSGTFAWGAEGSSERIDPACPSKKRAVVYRPPPAGFNGSRVVHPPGQLLVRLRVEPPDADDRHGAE